MNRRIRSRVRRELAALAWAALTALFWLSPRPAAADEAPPPPPDPAPLRWAGTTLASEHALTLTSLGTGPDYVSAEGGFYSAAFALSPGFFAFWHPRHQIRLSTRVVGSIEVPTAPNDAVATTGTELDTNDIPLALEYSWLAIASGSGRYPGGPSVMRDPTLLGRGDLRLWIQPSLSISFPTSRLSRARGVHAAPSIGLSMRLQVKLLGEDAPALQHLFITASERYVHTFAESRTPEPMSTVPVPDSLTHAASLVLPLYRGLELSALFALQQGFAASTPSGCVHTSRGCVTLAAASPSTVDISTFAVRLSYLILPELSAGFGYRNTTPMLNGNTGTGSGFFYSNFANLDADVTLSIDRLYQRFAARP